MDTECSRMLSASLTPGLSSSTCMPKASREAIGSYSSAKVSMTIRSWYLLFSASHSASREVPEGTKPSDWYTEIDRVFFSGTPTQMRCIPSPAGSGAKPKVMTRGIASRE